MGRVVSIGKQSYESMITEDCFFVDKTYFIKEWWEAKDEITLITRPRRFGKTLNMRMLECFFSNKYEGRNDLFKGKKIWQEEKYRELQGSYPVVFLSFASVKAGDYENTKKQICTEIYKIYQDCRFLLDSDVMSEEDKRYFRQIDKNMDLADISNSINILSKWLSLYYGKKVIILLDEYDTPMQEAWLGGYWDDIIALMRSFFNATFKTNPYLERAVMTGITRVSKESIFSDLNNLKVITSTSCLYETCFGFTEEEVFDSLDEMGMSEEKIKVKKWYDGFTFGKSKDIYNPWSITNFLDEKIYKTYWADTSSNGLISNLLLNANKEIKQEMEILLKGETIEKELDEQIVFSQLSKKKNAVWSLFLAGGYLRIESWIENEITFRKICKLKITNFEVMLMFNEMINDWFDKSDNYYNSFIKAMLKNNIKEMNIYMNEVALSTFSYFDSGNRPSKRTEPERFYHGFVLGLLVDLRGRYEVKSNRESGYGRYDVCLIPVKEKDPAIVIEFKVIDRDEEKTPEDTVKAALKQIEEMKYDEIFTGKGISQDRIYHYGFAFQGKKVLIGS